MRREVVTMTEVEPATGGLGILMILRVFNYLQTLVCSEAGAKPAFCAGINHMS
jgi:hypothetical protein